MVSSLQSFKPFFFPSWDLEHTGYPLSLASPPFPFEGCLVSLAGLVQALHAPFLLQAPVQKLLLFLLLNYQFGMEGLGWFFYFILVKSDAGGRQGAQQCPGYAHRQPLLWQGLALPKASGWFLGRFLHGWSRSLVLPWKFSRLILFSMASRTPCEPETDGDGLLLGSFSCKRVKGKFSSRAWQEWPGAGCYSAGLSSQPERAGFGCCCAGASWGESSR